MFPQSPLVFTVRRCQPELVAPNKPTPREVKPLSDIDDQDGLRFQIPFIQFYPCRPSMAEKDPVQVIRQALAQTLVFYYPFSGRLREGPNRKLMVDCNAEGVLFIEADADVTLDQYGDTLLPPFHCFEELLYDVPGSQGISDCPLLLIQVTRFKCGGFTFAIRLNHAMSDASGLIKFLNAMAEIARGAEEPSLQPVWCRELLSARKPPRITCTHHEYQHSTKETIKTSIEDNKKVQRWFFFGPTEVATIRRRFVPHHIRHCSTFDILTACLWRCRTRALQLDPNFEVRMMCAVNVRAKLNSPLPVGYYGNEFVHPAAVTTAGKLCGHPFGYALELVMKAKASVNDEYVRSAADLMVIEGRPHHTVVGSYIVSDMSRLQIKEVDFGWGHAVYGGPADGVATLVPEMTSLYIPIKNARGEKVTALPICLTMAAMERFEKELNEMFKGDAKPPKRVENSFLIRSLI